MRLSPHSPPVAANAKASVRPQRRLGAKAKVQVSFQTNLKIKTLSPVDARAVSLRYDSKRDCVVGWSRPIYSPLNLTLPAIERPLPRRAPESDKPKTRNQRRQSQCHQSRLTYSCFAAALLQGLVISQLKQYAQLLQRGVVDIAAAGVPHGSACFEVKKFVQELSRKDVASK